MTTLQHIKKTWILAVPVILSQVGHMMVGVADSMMVGRLGAVPLASVAFANGIYAIFLLFGIGVSYGMTPLVAAGDGSNDKKQIVTVFKHGFVLNVVTGVVLVLGAFSVSLLFPFLDQEPEVLSGGRPYFLLISTSLLPLMFFQSFRQFSEGLSLTRQPMMISLAANVVNILLNYILIYGKLGVEPMGIMGAGLATVVSRVLMVFGLGAYLLFSARFKRYRAVLASSAWDWLMFSKIGKIGFPSGAQFVFEVGAFSAAAIMIGWYGAIPLASHQVALSLSALTYMASTGISSASTIRIGNQLGKKDYATLRQVGWGSFAMTACMMTLFGLIFILFRQYLPTLYISDVLVIELASQLLVIAALFQISDGLQAVGLGVLRGMHDVKIPTLVTFFSYWFLAIPVGYFLGGYFEMGSIGVWIGLLLGLSLSAFLHISRFKYLLDTKFRK